MDIIAQLKAERDKAAQQVNALDTAINTCSSTIDFRYSGAAQELASSGDAAVRTSVIHPKASVDGVDGGERL